MGGVDSASSPTAPDLVAAGELAMSQGAWDRACDSFEAALAREMSPEGLDGLARALWWLDRPAEAIDVRMRAYALFRRTGDVARAVRIALWLVHEYSAVHGNEPAAEGWLARAEHLLTDRVDVPERGYLALAKAERCLDPAVAAVHAEAALVLARRLNDPDLELAALSRGSTCASATLAQVISRGLAAFGYAFRHLHPGYQPAPPRSSISACRQAASTHGPSGDLTGRTRRGVGDMLYTGGPSGLFWARACLGC